jgi:hypothetical protein
LSDTVAEIRSLDLRPSEIALDGGFELVSAAEALREQRNLVEPMYALAQIRCHYGRGREANAGSVRLKTMTDQQT